MQLHQFKPYKKQKKKKRVGRGPGSGLGKTCGRGHKGQKARAGSGAKPGFEGGQIPLIRHLPKRGFVNRFSEQYKIVNIDKLNKFPSNSIITPKILKEHRIIKSKNLSVKILGEGSIDKPLVVKSNKFSKTAIEKIEKAGGKIELIPKPIKKTVIQRRYNFKHPDKLKAR